MNVEEDEEELSRVTFRFFTRRDLRPPRCLHFTLFFPSLPSSSSSSSILSSLMSSTSFRSHCRLLFSSFGFVEDVRFGPSSSPSPSRPFGFVLFSSAIEASRALTALHQRLVQFPFPFPSSFPTERLHWNLSFASISSSSRKASSDVPSAERAKSALRFFEGASLRALVEALHEQRSVHQRFEQRRSKKKRHEQHLGEALREEDGRFGWPRPVPLSAAVKGILTALSVQIERATREKGDGDKALCEASDSPPLWKPPSFVLGDDVANDGEDRDEGPSSWPRWNRVTLHPLPPGAGVRIITLDTRQFAGTQAFVALENEVCLDVYAKDDRDDMDMTFLACIRLPPSSLLFVPSSLAQLLAFGVAFRTRDAFRTDNHLHKRLPATLVHLRSVLPFDRLASPLPDVPESLLVNEVSCPTSSPHVPLSTAVRGSKRIISQALPPALALLSPDALERHHVHAVYDTIATHFSNTRHSPWPKVEGYVKALSTGKCILDVACGNGKYMGLNPNIHITGCDISEPLVAICCKKGYHAIVADCLHLPFRDNEFDGAISIALLHHLSTPERRQRALNEMLRVIRPKGQVLVSAWAMEQDELSRRQFESQDVLVPWSLPKRFHPKRPQDAENPCRFVNGNDMGDELKCQRYCHVYREGEIEALLRLVGNNHLVDHYYDRGNWVVLFEKA